MGEQFRHCSKITINASVLLLKMRILTLTYVNGDYYVRLASYVNISWQLTVGGWRLTVGGGGLQLKYRTLKNSPICTFAHFHIYSLDLPSQMVVVAQLVRALDCGSRGRGFEPRHPPIFSLLLKISHPLSGPAVNNLLASGSGTLLEL